MQSVIIAYSLAMATLIPASGWLADRFGTRRVYLAALALFTAGSLWCAMAPTLSWLTAARALQGAGGAMLLPVGRLAVLRAFPRERFLPAMAFVAVPGLIGPLLGPTLGGWLVEYASWHWIFLINLPIGVAGCLATMALMPDFRASAVERFDFSGYLLLAASMVSISLALDGMADMRMAQAVVLVLVLFGLVCLAAYWLRAARQPAPLFPPALFQIASFRVGTLGNLFARIGNSSMPFLIPLLLQVRLGYSALHAGPDDDSGGHRRHAGQARRPLPGRALGLPQGPDRQYGAGGLADRQLRAVFASHAILAAASCNWPCSARSIRCSSRR